MDLLWVLILEVSNEIWVLAAKDIVNLLTEFTYVFAGVFRYPARKLRKSSRPKKPAASI